MAKKAASRTVHCYHCRHRFDVSGEALSIPCPRCHKTVALEDVLLKKNRAKLVMLRTVQTCGRVVVPKGARLVADLVEAHEGIEVMGHLEAKQVVSPGHVVIGKKAFWRGNLRAVSLEVQDLAVIERSHFVVPDPSVELPALPRPPESS